MTLTRNRELAAHAMAIIDEITQHSPGRAEVTAGRDTSQGPIGTLATLADPAYPTNCHDPRGFNITSACPTPTSADVRRESSPPLPPPAARRLPAEVGVFLTHMEKRLKAKRDELQSHLYLIEVEREPGDATDHAQRMEQVEMSIKDRAQKIDTLVRVGVALVAIDEGRYLECKGDDRNPGCEGAEIARKRLNAVPWTRLCIECAEAAASARRDPYPIGEMGVAR